MSADRAHHLRAVAFAEEKRGPRVPELMERDLQAKSGRDTLQVVCDAGPPEQSAIHSGEDQVKSRPVGALKSLDVLIPLLPTQFCQHER